MRPIDKCNSFTKLFTHICFSCECRYHCGQQISDWESEMKENVHPGSLELLIFGRVRQQQDQIVNFSLTLKSKLSNGPRCSAVNQLLFTLYSSQPLKSPEGT